MDTLVRKILCDFAGVSRLSPSVYIRWVQGKWWLLCSVVTHVSGQLSNLILSEAGARQAGQQMLPDAGWW